MGRDASQGAIQVVGGSLRDFDEFAPSARLSSPRSLQACAIEGVDPTDLVHRPIGQFEEPGLSPRLVKLRFDFFDAKRRDLLSSCRKRYEDLVNSGLASTADHKGSTNHNASQYGAVQQELEKLKLVKTREKQWLARALKHELEQLRNTEEGHAMVESDNDMQMKRLEEQSRRTRELNDRRAELADQKRQEQALQLKLDRKLAKAEFERQQEEMQREMERQAQHRREQIERNNRMMQEKLDEEKRKEQAKEEQILRQRQRLQRMEERDMERMTILQRQKYAERQKNVEKQMEKEKRVQLAIRNNDDHFERKMEEHQRRLEKEAEREMKLDESRAIVAEENAKRSFQTMMKRKLIKEEGHRKLEERRQAIMDHQQEVEIRLFEHEAKKERYLEFKRELDALKSKNKELNVLRQRRREEHRREMFQEAVCQKDEKVDRIKAERSAYWEARKKTGAEAAHAREKFKQQILQMRIKSKVDPEAMEAELQKLLADPVFNPETVSRAQSLPTLHSSRQRSSSQPRLA
mmetsp:Transcript_31799/g.69579  ORF Transcript_31799/g.69579 Transcript_31799/m.69579 type:complete len:521 (-) Transcript_31799:140-1702(-)